MTIDIDWTQAWRDEQAKRKPADDPSGWSNRAPNYAKVAGTSSYAPAFIERMGIKPGESVFDMGCGPGTLSIPLAQAGHRVYACDFSQAMLDELAKAARAAGVDELITAKLLAWDDDWSDVDVPVCDLAIASRSIATGDMEAAIRKLDARASRRVCVTLTTGFSPRVDDVLLHAIGRKSPRYPDCVFAFNILWQMGKRPDVSYINSFRSDEYASFEAAIDKNASTLQATPQERELLVAYSREHLHEDTDADGAPCWKYDHERLTSWAFLAWDK